MFWKKYQYFYLLQWGRTSPICRFQSLSVVSSRRILCLSRTKSYLSLCFKAKYICKYDLYLKSQVGSKHFGLGFPIYECSKHDTEIELNIFRHLQSKGSVTGMHSHVTFVCLDIMNWYMIVSRGNITVTFYSAVFGCKGCGHDHDG